MLLYWKKFDKVEKEHRKKAEKEAQEQRKQDEEMREVSGSQIFLTFLISPSESITIAFLRWSAAAGANIFGVEIMAWAFY